MPINPPKDNNCAQTRIEYLSHHLKQSSLHIIDAWGEQEQMSAIRDDLTVHVITSYATIEELSARIITTHVIDDRFNDEVSDYVYSSMSQSHREQLLRECGIFGNPIIGELSRIRGLRNKIAHEPYVSLDWHDDSIDEILGIIVDILDRLTYALPEREIIEKAINHDGL